MSMSDEKPNPTGAGNGGVIPPVEHRFKPGQSGNPAGRAGSAGSSVREWINAMAEWTVAELQAVKDDPKATAAKRTAARLWMEATSDDANTAGNPIAGAAFDRIMDRTEGRPKQAVSLSNAEPITGVTFEIVGKP